VDIQEVEQIIRGVDFDKSGYVDYSEFITAALAKRKVINEGKLETCFRSFD